MNEPAKIVSFGDAYKKALAGESLEPAKSEAPPPEAPKPAPEPSKPDITFSKPDKKRRFEIGQNDPSPPAPEPIKTEKPAEQKPADSVNDKADKPEKPGEQGMANLRKQYESAKAELERIKAEKATGTTVDPVEIESIRKERDELAAAVKRLRIEESREFKEKFNAPIENAIKRAKGLVPADQAARLEWLLRQPNSDSRTEGLEAIAADLSPWKQADLSRLAGTIGDVVFDRDAVVANAGHQMEAQAKAQANAQREWSDGLFAETLKAASEDLPMFQLVDGDEAHNAQVAARVARAKQLMVGQNDPTELAEAVFWSVVGKDALPLLSRAQKEIVKLQSELDGLRAARPNLTATAGTESGPSKPKSFVDAFKSARND
jgi:hypothetical protein